MNDERGFFDRFADRAERTVAHAGFFSFCVAMVVVWGISYPVFGSVDSWQLVINTTTTVITFLLLALLHNTQVRFQDATNKRLEDLEESVSGGDPVADQGQKELYDDG